MEFLNHFLPTIEHWGRWIYWLILFICILESIAFIGLAVPGTTVLIFTGFLVSQKILDPGDALWVAALGGIIGDTLSFLLGKRGAAWFREDHKIFKLEYLKKGEEFFHQHGDKSVILARFIGPIRPIVPVIAGLSKMSSKKFFFFNILGAFVSAAVYLTLGYFFGQVWDGIQFWIKKIEIVAVIMALVLTAGFVIKKIALKK